MTDTRFKRFKTVVASGALALVFVLSGCVGPEHDSQAMVEESERVLAIAEDVIPAIADYLDLTISETQSTPFTGSGSVGLPRTFSFQVQGGFDGELPTQRALEDAMLATGFSDIITEQTAGHARPGTDESPRVVAQNQDGSVQASIQLVTGTAQDGLRFAVSSLNNFYISDEAHREYFWDLVPEFDQSLVEPAAR